MRTSPIWLLLVFSATHLPAQQAATPPAAPAPSDDPAQLSFMQYDPPSTLKVSEHPVPRAKFPFVDVHSHQFDLDEAQLRELVAEMDKLNMGVMVNLSGRGFERKTGPDGKQRYGLKDRQYLLDAIALSERVAPGRIVHFTNVDFSRVGGADWPAAALAELEADVAAGARGLKIYKGLGMDTEDVAGQPHRGRRPAPRADLGGLRAAGHSGADPHRRSGTVLAAKDQGQRAPLRDDRDPRAVARPGGEHAVGAAHRRAARPLPRQPEDDLHQRPPGLAGQRPRPARQAHGRSAERDDRDRRRARRARPPAALRARLAGRSTRTA